MSEGLSKGNQGTTGGSGTADLNAAAEGTALQNKPGAGAGISAPLDEAESSEKIANMLTKVIEQTFSGPIPPPNIIEGYEKVVPGAADRIIRMAEQQSQHRQSLELMEVKAEVRDSLLGVIFAFGLGIGCLIACVVTVVMVPQGAGAVCGALLGATGIGSIVAAFLKNTRPPDK